MNNTGKLNSNQNSEEHGKSLFNFQLIYRTIILNWYWFVLSIIICIGLSAIYLRYVTPIYQTQAKLLIKDADNRRRSNTQDNFNLGIISNSAGIDNEIEILSSSSLAQDVVRDLKLYINYSTKGRIKQTILYKDQPLNVDIDRLHLEHLNQPISLTIKRENSIFSVEGTYSVSINDQDSEGPFSLQRKFSSLPTSIITRAGTITITSNNGRVLRKDEELYVTIESPKIAAKKYSSALNITQSSKGNSIAVLSLTDEIPQRAIDFLKQLSIVYNRQANEDKNMIALRTENFINNRLSKINAELGATESQLQNYKQENGMVELEMNAESSLQNQTQTEQKLADLNTQIELFNSIASEVKGSYRDLTQVIPSNVGLSDATSSSLIDKYNEIVMERNRLLRSASPNSPIVQPLTEQIHNLNLDIRKAIETARNNLKIQRDAIAEQFNKYNSQVAQAPQQERKLNQISRQQEVRSGLYLMLLQKREENNMSLASIVDKGKLIDEPQFAGKVSPNNNYILLIALLIGILIPSGILFLIQFFRYKIEGHDDVVRLTKIPIIADVPIASSYAKRKADIVVHENQNNQMEEVFRSMRTNLQFMLEDNQKVVLFTSSTSGEGKTFTAANLSVSFALLGKKVIFIGLDIRRPRLAELFRINNHNLGITNLLIKNSPTFEDIKEQIVPSGINDNLDLLMAGPIPPNPTELLARHSLNEIFNILKNKYDYIIIDTAPIGLVTDTFEIAKIADASVYMCRADYTPKSSFEMINEFNSTNKLPKISIVLNGIDMSKKKYGYYYGYGKYRKYSRYGYGKDYTHGRYGNYNNSHYGNKIKDKSIKQ